ncbi:hypothetical protein EK21DRAFT_72948, partial [Setomelanomma holmii]
QQQAIEYLKHSITSAPALITLDHKHGSMLFVAVDASKEGRGAVLEQISLDRKRHLC